MRAAASPVAPEAPRANRADQQRTAMHQARVAPALTALPLPVMGGRKANQGHPWRARVPLGQARVAWAEALPAGAVKISSREGLPRWQVPRGLVRPWAAATAA